MRTRRVLIVISSCGLALVACGSDKPSTSDATTTTNSSRTSTSAIPTTGATGAHVDITLSPTVNGRELRLRVQVAGLVPVPYSDETGQPIPSDSNQPALNTRVFYGDGAEGGADGGQIHCVEGAALVPINMTFEDSSTSSTSNARGFSHSRAFAHTYAKAGTYSVKFTVRVCGLGDVSKSVDVTIN
jgi:hypothetical protein